MSVRVIARIRPLLKNELDKDIIVQADNAVGDDATPPTIVRIPNPKKKDEDISFQFNSVYDARVTQQELFENEVAPTIKHLFNGYDVTLFAYGVTGTGKTHTMRGGKSLADRGMIPRLLSGIYRRSRKIEKDSAGGTKVEVAMSYYEIYNDKVFDLFEGPDKRTISGLPLRDNGSRTVVVGLTEKPCDSLKEFESLYDQANMNRSTSATKLNAHSSRSHAILCVKVTLITGDTMQVSTASAIDLAGSEDNRRTDNNKERLVESSSINKSLFVLGQCVEAISKQQSRIPYRESKMTRILALGQNKGLCVCLLNLAPVQSYHLDTLSSLSFASRTRKVEIREVENEPVFKGCSRPVPSFTGPSIQRQPLRPLSSTVHNAIVRPIDAASKDPAEKAPAKPSKAFSVYSDKSRTFLRRRSSVIKHSSPLKRATESSCALQISKTIRTSPVSVRQGPQQAISQAAIEDMIEKKLGELLAARAMSALTAPQKDISDEVKRRLELLEQKVEQQLDEKDDDRAEGLNFLLMAKQHQARGEDSSALRMYELAKAYFPDNQKLDNKIAKLRSKLEEKKAAARSIQPSSDRPPLSFPRSQLPQSSSRSQLPQKVSDEPAWEDDDDYPEHEPAEQGDEDDSDSECTRRKAKPKKPRRKVIVTALTEDDAVQTPRTERLLTIISSRDVAQIRALKGVGAKKAEAIVEAMCEDEPVKDLMSLGRLKGVGAKTVENMRLGLVV